MELLLSNFSPGRYDSIKSSREVFDGYVKDVEILRLATGYVSSDSLIELKKIIEINKKPRIEMLIGMHFFEGFSKPQYDAAISLNEVLMSSEQGGFVKISNTVKFHGKIYSFIKEGRSIGSIVGSSNLNSVVSRSSVIYEADFHIQDSESSERVNGSLVKLINDLGTPISDVKINSFIQYNALLENQYGVDKIKTDELVDCWKYRLPIEFDIPIKCEPKSNLNIFFGKGRVNQRGFEMPRPWYEAELIVSKKITGLEDYPCHKSFKVITDDGWTFNCKTSGDFSKNFRSEDDLKILGKWLKGKLENSGALKIGEPVTPEILNKYGSSTLKLIKSNIENTWLLEFKPHASK